MMTETALHAHRHKRVMDSRARIAAKARKDHQLREEARIRRIKSAMWLEDVALAQQKAERKAVTDQAKELAAARSRTGNSGWFEAAKAKVGAFLRRRA